MISHHIPWGSKNKQTNRKQIIKQKIQSQWNLNVFRDLNALLRAIYNATTLWKIIWWFLILKIDISYDPSILFIGIYSKELKALSQRIICIPVFIIALLSVAKMWRQPQCPLMNEWISQMWFQFSSVQFSYLVVSDSVIPWTAAYHTSLSISKSQSLLKLMPIELVMPSNHLILCHLLLLLPSIFLSIRVLSNESALHNQAAKVLEFQLKHQSFQ